MPQKDELSKVIDRHISIIGNYPFFVNYIRQVNSMRKTIEMYQPLIQNKEFEIVMNEVDDEFILNYLMLQKQAFDKLLKEKSKKDFPFLVHLETFEEKIQNEISVINLIDNSENDESTLEAINFPPGTPIKKKLNEDFDRNDNKSNLEYITSNELMKMLGVGRTTIYNYMKSGKIKAKKVGRKNLFRVTEVKNLIENDSFS